MRGIGKGVKTKLPMGIETVSGNDTISWENDAGDVISSALCTGHAKKSDYVVPTADLKSDNYSR